MVEGLSKLIGKDKKDKNLTCVKIAFFHYITHLLFVDDVILVGNRSIEYWETFHGIIKVFCEALGMEFSLIKSCFPHNDVHEDVLDHILIMNFSLKLILWRLDSII